MAQELKKVEPGELIKSDLINLIIDKLQEHTAKLSGLGGTGSVTVPYLFGRTLSEAATIIKQPQLSLQFGNVVDAFGVSLDPDLNENKSRIILNQVPDPGVRVNPNSLIDVLLAAKPSSTSGGPPPSTMPSINSTTPFNPAMVPIGQDVTIFGNNFALDRTKNIVTFAGVPTAEAPTSESTKTKLVVKVPVVPNPPSTGQELEVDVIVEVQDVGRSNTAKLKVLPALAGQNPTITTIQSSDINFARVGETITFRGSGFSTTQQQNVVSFDTSTTFPAATGITANEFRVVVPPIAGVVRAEDNKDVSVFVTVNGRKSNVIPFIIGG